MAADSDIAPAPAELDKVRVYLEYQAAKLPGARAGELLSFSVDPQIEAVFGKAPAGAFASERALVEYVLEFVNGAAVDLPESDPRVMLDIDRIFKAGTGAEHWRGWLKRFLVQLHADRSAARRWATKQMPDIWVLPWGARTANGIGLHFRVLLLSAAALARFVVLLLADESRDLGLCKCKLTRCGKFFLKAPTKGRRGAPQHVYCGPRHMIEARKADAIVRAEGSRRRRGAERLLRDIRPAARKAAVKQAFQHHPDATAEQLADYARALIQTARKHK